MSSRIGKKTVASDALFAAGVVSLVGGISLLFCANSAFNSLAAPAAVSIHAHAIDWLKNGKIATAPTSLPTMMAVLEKGNPQEGFTPLPQRRLALKKIVRQTARAPKVVRDQIQTTSARASAVNQGPSEHLRLQNIYSALRGNFLASTRATASVVALMPIQRVVAPAKPAIQIKNELSAVTTQSESIAQTDATPVAAQEQPQRVVSVQDPLESKRNITKHEPAQKKEIAKIAVVKKPLSIISDSIVARSPSAERPDAEQAPSQGDYSTGPPANDRGARPRAIAPPIQWPSPAEGEPAPVTVRERYALAQKILSNWGVTSHNNEYSLEPTGLDKPVSPAEYSPSRDLVSTGEAPATVPAPAVKHEAPIAPRSEPLPHYTGPPAPVGGEQQGLGSVDQIIATAAKNLASPQESPSESGIEPLVGMAAPLDHGVPGCIEGFDWEREIELCDEQQLTRENGLQDGRAAQGGAWILTNAKEHWSTLSWREHRKKTVPLIASNAVQILGRFAETKIQADAGIVFGKIGAGWALSISGRSEHPVYLDQRNVVMSGHQLESERYFSFVNVEPGASIVNLRHVASGAVASLVFPVVNGVATYLDLSRVSFAPLVGWVYNGSDPRAPGQAAVTVRVIDQPASAQTDSDGSFRIGKVGLVGDYPIHVETGTKDGYPHRYRINRNQAAEAVLFRFSDKMIDEWVGQVEGGVSTESAIIIGAVPGIVARESGRKIVPQTKNLLPTQLLAPETYALSATGDLDGNSAALNQSRSRFIALQVPGGPVVVGAKNEKGERVWSELLLTSPRVVNVVGPY